MNNNDSNDNYNIDDNTDNKNAIIIAMIILIL